MHLYFKAGAGLILITSAKPAFETAIDLTVGKGLG
jgi:hypothetical protein